MNQPESYPPPPDRGRFLWNVVWKALLLFAAANLLFAAFPPNLGRVSAYNLLFPGRPRFPFGENPEQAFNFTLNDLDALYASHEIARPKAAGELRVVVLGDSSVWGTLLRPEQTLPAQLEALLSGADLSACGGRAVQVYNLGYPTLSLTKDLLILEQTLEAADPDLIVWPVTLESMPRFRQAESPVVAANAERLRGLRQRTGLEIFIDAPEPEPFAATLTGQRRSLSDWARLQLYGLMWAATGVDQYYPPSYEPAARDLEAEEAYYDWPGPDLPPDALALDALAAGVRMAEEIGVPLLLVNEPILISSGENSGQRYNFYYPRWAYDQYRMIIQGVADGLSWNYIDAWDLAPDSEFTNTAIHLTPAGEQSLAELISPTALALACPADAPVEEAQPTEELLPDETEQPTRELSETEAILPTEPGGYPPAPGQPSPGITPSPATQGTAATPATTGGPATRTPEVIPTEPRPPTEPPGGPTDEVYP